MQNKDTVYNQIGNGLSDSARLLRHDCSQALAILAANSASFIVTLTGREGSRTQSQKWSNSLRYASS